MNATSPVTQISSADLLQADVTIIAGVLVLLTISVIYDKAITSKFWGEPLMWCAFMPIGFIISAALLLVGSLDPNNAELYRGSGILAFVLGLAFVMIAIFIIISIIKSKKETH